MGKFVTVQTNIIRPSQDFLTEKTVKFIFRCIDDGALDLLPPDPIVRRGEKDDELVAIDGHNLLAVKDFMKQPCRVYIADSKTDFLPADGPNTGGIIARNEDLQQKYDSAYQESLALGKKGLGSFKALSLLYPQLFND